MTVICEGSFAVLSSLQPEKHPPSVVMLSGRSMLSIAVSANASVPISDRPSLSVTLFNAVHRPKAFLPILTSPLPDEKAPSDEAPSNAPSPISDTVSGSDTPVIDVQPANAYGPIVTSEPGSRSIVSLLHS